MRMLIRIVFVIFIANGIDCLGRVCDDCCDCFKEKKEEEKKEKEDDEKEKKEKEYEKIEGEGGEEKKDEKDKEEKEEEEMEENENLTPEDLVNYNWYNAKKENLVLKIFKKKGDIFTSTENEDKISFKLDEKDNSKIAYQDETGQKLKLNDQKYALFGIKTEKGKNTVYLYCSDVESCDLTHLIHDKKRGIFYNKDHVSISVIACDTEKVTDMGTMFYNCCSLENLNLNNFNTTNVTNMMSMFRGCRRLTELNIKSFNTTKVTDMSYMFAGCVSLKNLDISNFYTTNVMNMKSMFFGCTILKNLDISNFNTEKKPEVEEIFDFCDELSNKIKKKILGEDI